MPENYITTDPDAKIALEPGALYFADFEIPVTGIELWQHTEAEEVKKQIESQARIKFEDAGHTVKYISAVYEGVTWDKQWFYTTYTAKVRVYFRIESPALWVAAVVIILISAISVSMVGYFWSDIFIGVGAVAQNVATTAGDLATDIVKSPQKLVGAIGANWIPLLTIGIAVTMLVWVFKKG